MNMHTHNKELEGSGVCLPYFSGYFNSLRIWGEKKNCSLLGALVFPLKIKTHKS